METSVTETEIGSHNKQCLEKDTENVNRHETLSPWNYVKDRASFYHSAVEPVFLRLARKTRDSKQNSPPMKVDGSHGWPAGAFVRRWSRRGSWRRRLTEGALTTALKGREGLCSMFAVYLIFALGYGHLDG